MKENKITKLVILSYTLIALLISSSGFANATNFHISKASDHLIEGLYQATSILNFEAEYTAGSNEVFSIQLSVDDKRWTTNIVIDANNSHQANVMADSIVLSEADRDLLTQTALHLSQYGEEQNSNSLLLMLLTQMITYWSKSPSNYTITSGVLGS